MCAKKRNSKAFKMSLKQTKNYAPGELKYTGYKTDESTSLEIIDYSKDRYDLIETEDVEDAFKFKGTKQVTWINVNGLNNTKQIELLGNHYNLHPLIQEDIVTVNQRPKLDEYDDYLFIVFKMLHCDEHGVFVLEHVSMVVGDDYILTFQEADGDVFDAVRNRIKNTKGRIRGAGADYLMFSLLDAVVDNYFNVIEVVSEKIEFFEDKLFGNDIEEEITKDIQELKKEIIKLRRAIFPLREVINRLEKTDSPLIEERTNNYIRDLYNHIIQVSESVEIYREMIWGLMDMYMTTISNKMNEIMKVLTIMASIFIPLTFIAGVYGMNFEDMPELKFKYGYLVVWGVMIAVFIGMLMYFKRKKWL